MGWTVNEIFGVSMTTIMLALLALLALCLLSVAWVAWRRPVVFKLGVRNIPRRRAQTTLIVVGLMLSTLIIAAALGTGDTIDYSATSETYRQLGEVDELVVYSKADDGEGNVNSGFSARFDQSVVDQIEQAFAGDPRVDGVMPVLVETVPVVVERSGQGEPQTNLVGIDPGRLTDVGGLRSVDGQPIDLAATPLDSVVLSETAAEKLDAVAGDKITIFYGNRPLPLTVAAIAVDSPLSGRFDPINPGMVVPLDRLQAATGQQGQVTLVAVSNRGGVRDGLDETDAVVAKLKQTLDGQDLGVDPIKRNSIDLSKQFAQIFTGLFLILGLFSIGAGILLIVLIFTMLAAERRPEMGMARAVGTQRRQLIQQFVSEGSGYALLAGLVGAALGAAAAYGIAAGLNTLFGDFGLEIEARVTPRSLVVAYCLGVVITFLAVVGSSWKISRLNIVAAVRDIPDVSSPKRKKLPLLWAALLLLVGGLSTWQGKSAESAFFFYSGMSLLPFGVVLILRFFGIRSRPIFTVAGLYLLTLWLLPSDTAERLFGKLDGNFEMFFLSGVFMVLGATIVIVNNLDLLLAGLSRLGALFQSKLPAVRTAIAYPGASKGRTGLTIAMFSLIVFSLVMFSTINQNFVNLFLGDEANAGWDVRTDAASANPIEDFGAALAARQVDTSGFQTTGSVTTANFQSGLRLAGTDDWKTYVLRGMDPVFIEESEIAFQQRAEGYVDDAAILEALRTDPTAAVVDFNALPIDDGPFGGGDPDRFALEGLAQTDKTFAPVTIEIENLETGQPVPLKVIGVIDNKISSLFGVYANQKTVQQIYPKPVFTSYFTRLAEPEQAEPMAKAIEAALLSNGVQSTSIRDELEDQQRQSSVFLYIIQGFMGLGLIVGIAAVGVITFRSVVERRQQIGMLRALGYQRSLVSLSFLIETVFVVGLGVLSGTILGLWLARNLFTSDEFASAEAEFVIPWTIVLVILFVTVVAALLMTWVPARQASKLAPAEALRYE